MLPPEQEGRPHFLPSADAHRAWPVTDICYSTEQAGSRLLRGEVLHSAPAGDMKAVGHMKLWRASTRAWVTKSQDLRGEDVVTANIKKIRQGSREVWNRAKD